MAFRLITQARPEDLAATQWALIAAVEETAGAALARYAAPAAALVIGELLAGARVGANGYAGRWASLLGQGLLQLAAQLQAEREQARGQVAGLQMQVYLLVLQPQLSR